MTVILLVISILLFIINLTVKEVPLQPQEFPILIDSGSTSSFTDSLNRVWGPDTGYILDPDGGAVDRGDSPIAGTVEDRIYQTEIFCLSGYDISVPNGQYEVKLHFAETFCNAYGCIDAAGQRIFDANVEGVVIDNIDIFAETGGRDIALIKTFSNVNVNDDNLDINFTRDTGEICPILNGIEINQLGVSSPVCGNNVKEGSEQCDSDTVSCTINGYTGTQACNTVCNGYNTCIATQSCGDGTVQSSAGEQCDDGNTASGYGCSSSCQNEVSEGDTTDDGSDDSEEDTDEEESEGDTTDEEDEDAEEETIWIGEISLTNQQLIGVEVELPEKTRVILDNGYIGVTKVNTGNIDLDVYGKPLILNADSTMSVDLDSDGVNDLRLTAITIDTNKNSAIIRFESIEEEATQPSEDSDFNIEILLVVIVVIVSACLIFLVFYILKRKGLSINQIFTNRTY